MSIAPTFQFGRGGAEAEEATKAQVGTRFARARYFALKDGEQTALRFLTDNPEFLYVLQHPSVPTKNLDPDAPNIPQTMPAVCRYDKAFGGYYKDCYVCDSNIQDQWGRAPKPVVRVWALACVREPITREVGSGYRDKTVEVDNPDGSKVKQREIIIVNMGTRNFFGALNGLYGLYGTVCDRDYVVKRSGTSKDTDYHVMPLEPMDDGDGRLQPGHPKWSRYTKEIENQSLDLNQIIAERASDEYFAKFFDPDKPWDWNKNTFADPNSPAAAAKAPDQDLEGRLLAGMKERIQGYSPSASTVDDE